jgi:hypothetical protein
LPSALWACSPSVGGGRDPGGLGLARSGTLGSMGSRYTEGVGKALQLVGIVETGDALCKSDTIYLAPSLLAGLVEHPRACHECPEHSDVYPQLAYRRVKHGVWEYNNGGL